MSIDTEPTFAKHTFQVDLADENGKFDGILDRLTVMPMMDKGTIRWHAVVEHGQDTGQFLPPEEVKVLTMGGFTQDEFASIFITGRDVDGDGDGVADHSFSARQMHVEANAMVLTAPGYEPILSTSASNMNSQFADINPLEHQNLAVSNVRNAITSKQAQSYLTETYPLEQSVPESPENENHGDVPAEYEGMSTISGVYHTPDQPQLAYYQTQDGVDYIKEIHKGRFENLDINGDGLGDSVLKTSVFDYTPETPDDGMPVYFSSLFEVGIAGVSETMDVPPKYERIRKS